MKKYLSYNCVHTDVCFFAALAVQHKDVPLGTSTSAVTLVSTSPASVAIVAASGVGVAATSSPVDSDLYIPTASADVAADIAKYTNKVKNCCTLFASFYWHHSHIKIIQSLSNYFCLSFLDCGCNQRYNDRNL